MKKLLAIIGVSLFMLSACDKAPATTKPADGAASTTSSATTSKVDTVSAEDKVTGMVWFFADMGCALAKFNAEIPAAEETAIMEKYGFSGEADIVSAVKGVKANKADIVARAVTMIESQCKEDFTKISVDPKTFVNDTFDIYLE